jgi:hypothetical protein
MLQGNPNFDPAAFKGRGKANGIAVWAHQLPITAGGVMGELPEGEPVARFGRVVSLKSGTRNTFELGVGAVPLGILIADPAIMQNKPAMNGGYFAGAAATIINFGKVQFMEWAIDSGLKAPSLGGKVLGNITSGEVGFVDFNDATPAGWAELNAVVIAVDEPNGATVFVGLKSLIVANKGIDVTGTVATPAADPAAGAVAVNTVVELSCATAGADIYYTLDGTGPVVGKSIKYNDPIVIDAAVTLTAIAVKSGMANSAMLTAVYTIA